MGKKTQSGSMHGEKFWTQEKDNVGMKMMQGMGWEKGNGIGKNDNGTQEAIRVHKKEDRVGIGATDTSDGMYYSAMNDVFNNLLTKLNSKKKEGGNGAAASAPADEEDGEPESMATSIKKAASKRRLYSKFVKAKDVGGYSDADKAKIFGTAGKKEEASDEEEDEEAANPMLQKSTMSMADYFKQKMAAAQGSAGPRRSPRLAAAAPDEGAGSMSMAAAAGMGLGFAGLGSQEEPSEQPKKEKKRKKDEDVDEEEEQDTAKKKKKKKSSDAEEAGGSVDKKHLKAVKKLVKAADGKSLKLTKLVKAFMEEVEMEKKPAKKAVLAVVAGCDELGEEDGVVTWAKDGKKKKKKKNE